MSTSYEDIRAKSVATVKKGVPPLQAQANAQLGWLNGKQRPVSVPSHQRRFLAIIVLG